MKTKYLEYIVDLYKTRSLSKTAKKFYTSHQAVSAAVSSIEEELNVVILERTRHGVDFTDAGMVVYHFADDFLNKQSTMLEQLEPYKKMVPTSSRSLHIYLLARFLGSEFYDLIERFKRKNKDIKVTYEFYSNFNFKNLLLNDNEVILLCINKQMHDFESMESNLLENGYAIRLLCEKKIGWCLKENSTWYEQIIEGKNIKDIPIITFSNSFNKFSDNILNIDNYEMMRTMLLSGNYVGLFTPFEMKNILKNKTSSFLFLPVQKISLSFMLLYKTSIDQNVLSGFIYEIEEYFEQI